MFSVLKNKYGVIINCIYLFVCACELQANKFSDKNFLLLIFAKAKNKNNKKVFTH